MAEAREGYSALFYLGGFSFGFHSTPSGGQPFFDRSSVKVVAFLTEYEVVERIIFLGHSD
jgi:hypothetical protein